ncbi:MAG: hypothetical protein A2937_03175 [Candidatus Yonathbacteria bacterium RIFCSPLOWO2_01_FULL_47_33b]|uniref:LysM domain-containing protein n=1 Tax=Candidatus Yonathbacteria bacterium RIFCSPLOWO2_01_FULL_47_33b TaxID=1802727 RepID=A0A1G2SFX5_9BACT|nr:MAG: hypothetical protein A2937_03175 [Candidatus Yonathbacteria bacterium RIFCSPLOWO2_01_FULL_47_33b]
MVVGFATPVSYAHAWSFSDFLNWTGSKASAAPLRVEPQNSQNMAFLEAATNVDPKKAMGGGDITVVDDSALLPDVGPSGTIADVESNDRQGRVSLYVVRKGDTIPQIAKMFGVNANTIIWANDLEKGVALRDGQTLVILPVNGVQHTVKKGDTIKSIAKKYKGDVDEILAFNDIEAGSQIAVGDVIIIPDGEEAVVSAPKASTQTSSSKRIASYPSYSGYYTHPVPGSRKTQGIHGYNGVDLAAPIGTPVLAAAEGTVIVSKFRTLSNPWFGGYGNYVIIEHPNGTQTLYGHMSAVYVAVGARVDKGQPIGEVGNTGKSTGAHLHFEVRGAKNPF